jgi:hypothetical protein
MNLADMRALVRIDLKDTVPGSYRWSDDDLDRAISRAVEEYSRHHPYPQKSTIATVDGSRDIDIATLTSRILVDKVEFPVGETPKVFEDFTIYQDTLTLKDRNGDGTNCYIYWGKMHVLGAASTIPTQDEQWIALGACAFALEAYADHTLAEKVQAALELAATALGKVTGQVTDAETALTAAAAVAADIATQLNDATSQLTSAATAIATAIATGAGSIDVAIAGYLTSAQARIDAAVTNITSANTAIGNIAARLTQAAADLTSGDDYMDTANTGEDVAGHWAEYAGREVEIAQGYNREADGYLSEAAQNLDGARAQLGMAAELDKKRDAHIAAGGRYVDVAGGYISQASELNKMRQAYLDTARHYIASTFSFIQEAGQHQRNANQYQDNSKALANQAKTKLAKFLKELRPDSIQRRLKFSTFISEE